MSTTTQTFATADELARGTLGSYFYAQERERTELTASTPLEYDGQLTNPDTGFIYVRARVYDPATEQFLSRDPRVTVTGEPYSYAKDNPLNYGDPSGLEALSLPIEGPGGAALCPAPGTDVICAGAAGYGAVEAGKTLVNSFAGEEPGNDEGEAELHTKDGGEPIPTGLGG
jgi:RHS repeat-associated protein